MSYKDTISHMTFTQSTRSLKSPNYRNASRHLMDVTPLTDVSTLTDFLQLTKAQRYSLAARNLLLSNGRTHYASQTIIETNPNVANLPLLPNSNVLLLVIPSSRQPI